jgi:hypothetical protein
MYLVEDYINELVEFEADGGLDYFDDTSDLFRILAAFAYAATGSRSVPREFWDQSFLRETTVSERAWMPWLSGAFGLGSTVRVRGDLEHTGKCVGIRAGRVIIEFPNGAQATLAPSSVEGRVDP